MLHLCGDYFFRLTKIDNQLPSLAKFWSWLCCHVIVCHFKCVQYSVSIKLQWIMFKQYKHFHQVPTSSDWCEQSMVRITNVFNCFPVCKLYVLPVFSEIGFQCIQKVISLHKNHFFPALPRQNIPRVYPAPEITTVKSEPSLQFAMQILHHSVRNSDVQSVWKLSWSTTV